MKGPPVKPEVLLLLYQKQPDDSSKKHNLSKKQVESGYLKRFAQFVEKETGDKKRNEAVIRLPRVGTTYLPGPSPAKYCGQERA